MNNNEAGGHVRWNNDLGPIGPDRRRAWISSVERDLRKSTWLSIVCAVTSAVSIVSGVFLLRLHHPWWAAAAQLLAILAATQAGRIVRDTSESREQLRDMQRWHQRKIEEEYGRYETE